LVWWTVFAYSCNLGPTQTARHIRGTITAHQLATTNHRHVTDAKLDAAIRDIINNYKRFYRVSIRSLTLRLV
jgi:Tn3 transposase DDE domain